MLRSGPRDKWTQCPWDKCEVRGEGEANIQIRNTRKEGHAVDDLSARLPRIEDTKRKVENCRTLNSSPR